MFFLRRFFILIFLFPIILLAQNTANIYGKITDERGKGLELVNVAIPGTSGGVTTDSRGNYNMTVPSDTTLNIAFSFIGYKQQNKVVSLKKDESLRVDMIMISIATVLPDAEVVDQRIQSTNLTKLNPRQATLLPSVAGGGIEDLIKTLPGVSSNNELSSQYTVRGGNFDENLVYVNGIEIYRPFLVSSGQQEGLSFINSQLVSNIEFSAGGFSAEYGDKLSSVLDITYKRPQETAASLNLNFLGAEMHVEGALAKNKFSYLVGARYKTTSYILNALDTKGSYKPNFTDVQTLLTYSFNKKWEISALGYYSRNFYKLIPESRQTDFGTYQEAFRLNIYFDGQEIDNYETGMGAITLNFKPHSELDLKLIASAYSTVESETYDIQSQYWIGKLETSMGDEQYGDVVQAQGVGTFIDHARNAFNASVINIDHKGTYTYSQNILKWGARYQHQEIDDHVQEWELIDSSGYTLPFPQNHIGSLNPPRPDLVLNNVSRSNNKLSLNNADAFIQNSWLFLDKNEGEFVLTVGMRANYWDYGKEINISPRLGMAYKPKWERNMVFRLSGGVYSQSPFYRELRKFDGSLFADTQSQRSYQAVLGSDLNFKAWNRPFIFTTEVYYKYFDNLIPYEVDNVRIRYFADQQATGYAAGLDLRLNGEFVKGIDSWASLSLMRTEEDVKGDFYSYYVNSEGERITSLIENQTIADTVTIFPGMIPRPSDQRLTFSILFQDYIPRYPTFRVHLRLVFGTRLPFGAPDSERYQQTIRMPSYRRVDVGFSKQLISEETKFKKNNPLKHVKNMWISLEVFNLLDINNTISYTWIKDINNLQYAVPNYLTPRQINLKLIAEF